MTESVTQTTVEPEPAPPEEFTARLRAQVHAWRDVSALSDDALAAAIRADGILSALAPSTAVLFLFGASGVLPVLKHLPGHGRASQDSKVLRRTR